MDKKKILLVEDEAILAMSEQSDLANYNYSTEHVCTGEEAIEYVKKNQVDLILMDINLGPGLDGTQAAEVILKEHDIPVLFLSSHSDRETVEKTEKITSYGYVVKGCDITILDASIKMAFKLFDAKLQEIAKETALKKSEERYRLLFETTVSGYALLEMIYDKKGKAIDCRYIDVNPAHEKLTGMKSQEIIGKTARECIENLEDSWIENYARVEKTGNPDIIENYVVGLNKWYKVFTYRPQMGYVAVTFDDITEQKNLQSQLTLSNNIVNSIQIGLHIYQQEDLNDDRTLRMVYANQAAAEIIGVPVSETVGKTLDENFPGLREKNIPQTYADVIKTNQSMEINDIYYGDKRVIEGAYSIKAFPLPDNKVGIAFENVTEKKKASDSLKKIEWLTDTKNIKPMPTDLPEYGDVTELNKNGIILQFVGKELLNKIVSDYINLLGSSSAIYERNGDYAYGIFSSGYCKRLDLASYKLCNCKDSAVALKSGKWLCHESCWNDCALEAINTGKETDIECNGGIHLYGVPIKAGDEILGAINFGYGNPPTNPEKIKEIADKNKVPPDELMELAHSYENRPAVIIELAKHRLHTVAQLIGEIVKRKQAEEKIADIALFPKENTNPVLRVSKDKELLYANKAGLKLMSRDGTKTGDLIPKQWHKTVDDAWSMGEKSVLDIELPRGLFRFTSIPIKEKNYINIYCEEISEQKENESKLLKTYSLLKEIEKRANIGAWSFDVINSTQDWSEQTFKIMEIDMTKGEPKLPEGVSFINKPYRKVAEEAIEKAITYGESYDQEWEVTTAKGNIKWVHSIGVPNQVNGKTVSLSGSFQDITDRIKKENKLKETFSQNESLLRELQHRAKNSFNLIKSMISLSASDAKSEEVKSELNNISQRIAAVSQMYELLYQTKSVTHIQLDEYLQRIISGIPSNSIKIKQQFNCITMAAKQATSIGIITNELITNTVKYAFPGKEKGTVTASIKKISSGAVLTINDDGKGLPDDFDISKLNSLGLKMVIMLTKQIKGTFKIEDDNGTKCTIEFPVEEM